MSEVVRIHTQENQSREEMKPIKKIHVGISKVTGGGGIHSLFVFMEFLHQ